MIKAEEYRERVAKEISLRKDDGDKGGRFKKTNKNCRYIEF